MRKLIVRSRNISSAPLKQIEVPITTIYRMGSTTPTSAILRNPSRRHLEINTIDGCRISGDKIAMKKAFDQAGVHHAEWCTYTNDRDFNTFLNDSGTVIAKHKHSSKGNGIFLINTMDDFVELKRTNNLSNFIFERYYTYSREYRIHVTADGCFYASRKMLINGASERWHRHSNNSVFINEENPDFMTPTTWSEIVDDCVKALKTIGLDIAAFDVKVNRSGKWILLESNSAPSLKERGIERYTQALNKIIQNKLQ